MRIAIVGAGISGLSAAHALRGRHQVVLYEREQLAGGHTCTVSVTAAGRTLAVDMGFIVYNRPTYPRFSALLDELEVASQPTDMSFGHVCQRCRLEFGSVGLAGFLAQPEALMRRDHWRMLADLRRFHADARRRLAAPEPSQDTLADLLDAGGYGSMFREHFLVPVVSAIWSTAADHVLDFPAQMLLRFLDNHGLIGFRRGKPWRTIVGGSSTYVRRIVAGLDPGSVRLGAQVEAIRRDASGVRVRSAGRPEERFDALVLATPADVARSLLGDADPAEATALGQFEYTTNEVVLHTRASLLPRHARARGSWNVTTVDCASPADALTMTYDMTRLQRLPVGPLLVSVNPGRLVADADVLARREMRHPRFTQRTLSGQRALQDLQGHRRTWHAGAHLGYGFHEDGCRSGQLAAQAIDAERSLLVA